MRLWSWCTVAAVLSVAGAGTIRRASTDTTRTAQRSSLSDVEDLERIQPDDSVRSRSFVRRRDGSAERDNTRIRSRVRPIIPNNNENLSQPEFNQTKLTRNKPTTSYVDTSNNERNSNQRSRYSRTRKKPDPLPEIKDTSARDIANSDAFSRNPTVRSRTRQNGRVSPTPASIETSSPVLVETKLETISPTFDQITQIALKDDTTKSTKNTERTASRFRQRSRVTPKIITDQHKETEITSTKKTRGRNNTTKTTTAKPDFVDTISSESINEVTIVFKEPTTARTIPDLRSSRKLRYKSKLSETDTNLTGEGATKGNEEIKSSQRNETTPSQTDKSTLNTRATFRPKPSRKPYQPPPSGPETNSEVKTGTRRRLSSKPSAALTKKSGTDSEISEDDNYPESFKALLQAKSASPQAATPKSESLSVKASQKVYNTFSPSTTDTKTSNAQRYSRFRPEILIEATKRIDSVEDAEVVESNNQSTIVKPVNKPSYKNRMPYLARYRKSSSFAPSSTEPTKAVIDKQKYKFNRPNKINITASLAESLTSEQNKTSSVEIIKSLSKNPVLRSTYYSRFRPVVQKSEVKFETDDSNKTTTTTNAPIVEDGTNDLKYEDVNELSQPLPLTTKFHASYKDRSNTPDTKNTNNYTPVPVIRNIPSRNTLSKSRTLKSQEAVSDFDDFEELTSKKYSESFSKTTLPTTNVIPGFEKTKSRFSSKYRAPLDRPMYLPTVPSVAPSSITSQALSISGKGSLATLDTMSGSVMSTPSHVLSLRTKTMLPSVNEIVLNSISSATKEEQVANIIEMMSSTREPRILTLDIDPETKMIRTEKPDNGMGSAVFKFIPIDEVKVSNKDSNVFKFTSTKPSLIMTTDIDVSTVTMESNQRNVITEKTEITKVEASTTERMTTIFTTTAESIPTTPVVLSTTSTPTSTSEITTTTPKTTTLPITTETEPLSTTILPATILPRRVAFRTTTEPSLFSINSPTTQIIKEPVTTNQVPEEIRISTTNIPVFTSRTRPLDSITTNRPVERTTMRPKNKITTTEVPFTRRVPVVAYGITTTDVPDTSTFSVEEDIAFLQNLKNVVNTNADDPETSLANRIIALAVERSLSDLSTSKDSTRSGKGINYFGIMSNRIALTTTTTSTTTTTTTTTSRPTTTRPITRPPTTSKSSPSIEEDIRQFEEDTKLLQALLKATGQNPANFKIPSIASTKTNAKTSPNKIPIAVDDDLKLLSNLLSSPSPLNEPFERLTQKPNFVSFQDSKADTSISLNVKPVIRPGMSSTTVRNDNSITTSIKDDLKSFQEDTKLLETLLQLQGGKTPTTQKNKLSVTGLTGDETLATLLAQSNKKAVAATKAPMTLSTEFGKTNDALLAALLKEQGFGPTTANSLEEQIKLAAILNQVIVTPKPRRVTTPPPPPPPPPPPLPAPARRPILDGLAWLWQQWQDTSPGPTRGARRPSIAAPTAAAAASAPSRVNWFGSGPFIGNADDAPTPSATSNRVRV